jgi:phosphatidylserine/phosphatidylglycerophosphate/cardiolipin synthase-like enzyme
MTIAQLRNRYFHNPPGALEGSLVTPLVDGHEYFTELARILGLVGTDASRTENARHFIYIAGWWLGLVGGDFRAGSTRGSTGPAVTGGDPFKLDGPGGTNVLIDLLKAKSRAGVDVRVLGWVSWYLMGLSPLAQTPAEGGMVTYNAQTIASIVNLRGEASLHDQCCLNVIGHNVGGVHTKMVIVGTSSWAAGFTGGIDLVSDRYTFDDLHTVRDRIGGWHDVQAKIEGPAVQSLFDFFRQMWNENLIRAHPVDDHARPPTFTSDPLRFHSGTTIVPCITAGTTRLEDRTLPNATRGTHYVQSLRTVPAFNYSRANVSYELPPISFAPNGIFEIRDAWRKAILAADQYIYIEDQYMISEEVMSWINQAIRTHPDLKVILLAPLIGDPRDPNSEPFERLALVNGLLAGLNPGQLSRVAMFKRAITIHAKTTLIDDRWALIGSANCARRSLYTDVEHAISVLDEGTLVRDYRVRLWGDHFNLPVGQRLARLGDINQGLNSWVLSWGRNGLELPSSLQPVLFPTRAPIINDIAQGNHDRVLDPDSRRPWGGFCT